MKAFPFAGAAEIIRAQQKDSLFEYNLQNELSALVQSVKGVRFVNAYARELAGLARLLYLGTTTLAGSRTLGEEYTDLIYVSSDAHRLPGWPRLATFVFLSSLGPVIAGRKIASLRQRVLEMCPQDSWIHYLVANATHSALTTANLALFYFTGAYYQLWKRVLGLRYALGHEEDRNNLNSYEFLGILLVLRTATKLLNHLRSQFKPEPIAEEKECAVDLSNSEHLPFLPQEVRRCNLCFDDIQSPTVTLCGHLFCWSCIAEWCRERAECPLCRQSCAEQNLLVLHA